MEGDVRRFVAAARVGRLATASLEGIPHVVPVCFGLKGDAVYIALDEKPKRVPPGRLRRVRNIVANPRVQLLVDHYEEAWGRLAFVQLSGSAAIIEGGAEHSESLTLLRAKYPQYREMALESRPVIRIVVDGVASWGDIGATFEHRT
jgi:PPOX class probable F420-dependent enzyme